MEQELKQRIFEEAVLEFIHPPTLATPGDGPADVAEFERLYPDCHDSFVALSILADSSTPELATIARRLLKEDGYCPACRQSLNYGIPHGGPCAAGDPD